MPVYYRSIKIAECMKKGSISSIKSLLGVGGVEDIAVAHDNEVFDMVG